MKVLNSKWVRVDGQGKLVWLVYKNGKKDLIYSDFPFLPYFFVRKDHLDDIPKEWLYNCNVVTDENCVTYDGHPAVKIETELPSQVGDLRRKIESKYIPVYEADIPYATKRVLIDLGEGFDIPEHVLWYDIEVDSRYEFPRPENPHQRILTIAAMDYSGKEYFFSYEDERKTILEFLQVARRYEILSGWNTTSFDWPYILARAERLGISIDSFLYPHIDLYMVYKEFFKRKQESYALSSVAKKILGREIEDWGISGEVSKMYELWKQNLGELKRYTMKQVECTKDIDLELQLIKTRAEICRLAHISPYTDVVVRFENGKKIYDARMLKNSSIIDGLILRRSIERAEKEGVERIVFPCRRREDEEIEEEDYEGGAVKDPEPGLHENVAVLDFSSTYPAIIQTFNVGIDTWSPEKLDDAIYAKHGCFVKHRNSLASEVIGLLVDLRMRYKKKRNEFHPDSREYKIYDSMQFGFKFTANSMYGVLGFESSRYYRWEVAENITSYSRDLLKFATTWFSRKYHILYFDSVTGDTCIIVRDRSGVIYVKRLDEFDGEWIKRPDGKEMLIVDGLEVWTANGWRKLTAIIRHRTNKRVRVWDFRFSAPSVTDDHSLISARGEEIRAMDVKSVDELMYTGVPSPTQTVTEYKGLKLDYDFGYLLGAYVADGSKRAGKILEELCGRGSENKHFPDFFLSTPREFQDGLLEGYIDGDGSRSDNVFTCSTISRKLASQIAVLAKSRGWLVRVLAADLRGRRDQRISYKLIVTVPKGERSLSAAKKHASRHKIKFIDLERVDYVYDVATDCGTFVDALGLVVLHNTDGFFVKPKFEVHSEKEYLEVLKSDLEDFRRDLKEFVIRVYNVPEKRYNIDLKIDRIFEKLYLTTKKKRYVARSIYEDDKWIEPYVHVKGFEIARSDWPEAAKIVQKHVIDMILSGRSMSEIRDRVSRIRDMILSGWFDDKFYVRKGISRRFEEYKVEPRHLKAAQMMMSRKIPVRVGDKIHYIDTGKRILIDHRELTRDDRRLLYEKYILPVLERFELDRMCQTTLDCFSG